MTERLNTENPFIVDFERIFSVRRVGREWDVDKIHLALIDEGNDASFENRQVIVQTDIPLTHRPFIKMCLDDNGVLFDTIVRKPRIKRAQLNHGI